MSAESVAGFPALPHVQVVDKGLKKNAIGFASNVVIGVASAAPAYSLAATLGLIVAIDGVGIHSPAVLLVAFLPMFLIAGAYRALNRVDPDSGTAFAWATRALGPRSGWLNGWAMFLADVIAMASLSQIATIYFFLLFGWQSAAQSNTTVMVGSVVWIAVMIAIAYRGVALTARVQKVLLSAEIAILALFAVVALAKVYTDAPPGSIQPDLTWFNPLALSGGALLNGILVGVFIYWGWDAGVSVNEESENSAEGPGKAAVLSTVLLVLIYVVVATAAQAFRGPEFLATHKGDVLSALGPPVLGSGGFDKALILAVLTSVAAATQTTILPAARTAISMSVWQALPKAFGRVHSRFFTPTFATVFMGVVAAIWVVGLLTVSPGGNALSDSIIGIGLPICFYYGFTGLACVVYFRGPVRESFRKARQGEERQKHLARVCTLGVLPLIGSLTLFGVFIKALEYYSHAKNANAQPIFGITLPLFMGIGGLLLGAVAMVFASRQYREFFARKREVAPIATLP